MELGEFLMRPNLRELNMSDSQKPTPKLSVEQIRKMGEEYDKRLKELNRKNPLKLPPADCNRAGRKMDQMRD